MVFEPTGEMQDDDGNGNQVKQGKQNIGQRVVPLSIGSLAVMILLPSRPERHPARLAMSVRRATNFA